MQVDGNKLKFDKSLWVQFEGVESAEEGDQLVLTARSDDAYVKVFNQFGRLLKLFTFSNGHWIDSETGAEPAAFDEGQAGRIAQPAAAPAARKPAAAVKKGKKAAAAARRSGAAMTMAKRKPGKKPAKGKSAAKSKSGGMRMMAKKKATAKKKTAKKPAKRKAPARKKTKAKSR